MDLATIIGLILGVVIVAFGIASGPDKLNSFGNFWDLASVLITIGGSLSVMVTSCSFATLKNGFAGLGLAIKGVKFDEAEIIRSIINLSNVARKEGLLALEEAANNMEDEFIKKGILLIVDGTDPELVRGIMETELACTEDRHAEVIGFWDNFGTMGPAFGMIGTLIGLVNMLKKLDDINSVGPNMATALLTTLYGSLIANWLCIPISSKLKANNAIEVKMKQVMIEGILSIQAGENPRVIEEKLKSFLSPQQREGISQENQGGE